MEVTVDINNDEYPEYKLKSILEPTNVDLYVEEITVTADPLKGSTYRREGFVTTVYKHSYVHSAPHNTFKIYSSGYNIVNYDSERSVISVNGVEITYSIDNYIKYSAFKDGNVLDEIMLHKRHNTIYHVIITDKCVIIISIMNDSSSEVYGVLKFDLITNKFEEFDMSMFRYRHIFRNVEYIVTEHDVYLYPYTQNRAEIYRFNSSTILDKILTVYVSSRMISINMIYARDDVFVFTFTRNVPEYLTLAIDTKSEKIVELFKAKHDSFTQIMVNYETNVITFVELDFDDPNGPKQYVEFAYMLTKDEEFKYGIFGRRVKTLHQTVALNLADKLIKSPSSEEYIRSHRIPQDQVDNARDVYEDFCVFKL